jgi:hypothetical protein
MKTLLCLTIALGTLAAPALTFAQTTPAPLTRAQVYADLVRVEKAGYNPALGSDPNYPADIQAAEAKVVAQQAQPEQQAQRAQDAVGGASDTGSSVSGESPTSTKPAECTGPASFCNIFSGS